MDPQAHLPDLSDEQLVSAARRREAGAFEKLLRRYNQRIFRIARAHVANDEQAEEIVQHAWVQVYATLDQWSGRGPFSAWAAAIVINACHRGRRHVSEALPADELHELEAGDSSPAEATHRLQVREVLERHVDALSATLRAVFVMREVEEMTGAEVAQALGISEEAVRVRLHRARRLIQDSLQEEFEGEGRALYRFLGSRCDRLTGAVLRRVGLA